MTKEINILKNYLLYFLTLFLVCLVGVSKVFAFEYTYTQVGELYSYTEQLVSTTYGSAPFNNPRNSGYAFSDVFQVDYIVSNYTFNANTNYQLESHLPNQVFTNVNAYKVSGLNGEACMTSYANSILNNDHYPRWAFQCPHQTDTITITIYNSTNQNLWSGTGIFNWSSALLWSSSTAMTSSDTNSIINNQNQNTQDIINNQNQNTQDIINSNKVCNNIDKANIVDNGKGLTINGGVFSSSSYGITDYIKINSNSEIKVLQNFAYHAYCYYTTNKELISCANNSDLVVGSYLTIPSNADYVRFTIHNSQNKPTFELCKNGSQSLDDTLNDDSVDENGVADAFDSFNDFLDDNSTITQLITLPITLYTAILNNLNGTCQPFNLGKLYGEDLILPCINISQYLGNSLWTMIDIIISGFAVYAISKKMIKVFNNFSSLREGDVIDD